MADRVAIVTGAGSGIGRAIALAFGAQGASVVVTGRTASRLEETAGMFRNGAKCVPHTCDVADAAQAADLINTTVDRFGRIDVLVNNAGQAISSRIEDLDLAAFDQMLKVNAGGVVHTIKAAWPVMKRQRGGTIINISSIAAVDPFPGLPVYGATKAFVNLLTKGLAEEGRKHGIAVFAVGPGAVETPMLRDNFPDFPAEQALPPQAIADVVVMLAEPAARPCTGQTIYVRK